MIYVLTEIAESPSSIGAITATGTRILEGSAGNGSFGPYGTLEVGRWFAGFNIRALETPTTHQAIKIDVCHNEGRDVLGEAWFGADDFCRLTPGLLGVTFQVAQPVTDYELRLHFAGSGTFEVFDKLIFRADFV